MKQLGVLLAFVFFTLYTFADEAVILKAQVDKAVIQSSDTLTYTIQLSVDKALGTVQVPEIGDGIVGFRVVDFGQTPATVEDGRSVASRWYKLQADISGSYVLPALEIKYKDQTGNEKSAKTSEIFVEVQTPGAQAADANNKNGATSVNGSDPKSGAESPQDIRDIKDIIPAKSLPWGWFLMALGLLAGLGYLIYYYFKNKKAPVVPALPPHEIALQNLELLKTKQYLETQLPKKFHFELSEIARLYLEGRFQIAASDRTTEELQLELNNFKLLELKQKTLFLGLIKTMDLVKFTDTNISSSESLEIWQQIKTFVLDTKPIELEPGIESGKNSSPSIPKPSNPNNREDDFL